MVEAVEHGRLEAALAGKMEQAVRVFRIAGDAVADAIVQAVGSSDAGHSFVECLDLIHRQAILPHQHLAPRSREPFRRGRIELERPVHHLDIGSVRETGERALEPALADVTPRAHYVGPDIDTHAGHCTSARLVGRRSWGHLQVAQACPERLVRRSAAGRRWKRIASPRGPVEAGPYVLFAETRGLPSGLRRE